MASSEYPTSMIIRTGHAHVEVDSLERAMELVREMAGRLGGYVSGSSIQSGSNQNRMATLELRVPADRYDQAAGSLGTLGKVISASTSTQDVGEEYVDLTARMANARRLEERLVNLLATRTGKLEDVLAVERELARVRQEIERYEGRLRYLRTQTSMSSLSITVSEPGPVVGQPGSNPLAMALREAWRNFVMVIARGIALTGAVLPVIVLVMLGWFGVRRLRRVQARPAGDVGVAAG